MQRKCEKFEPIFVFGSDENFREHIDECPDCQAKYAEMRKIEDFIKSAKPLYLKRKSSRDFQTKVFSAKIAACVGFIVIQFLSY